MLPEVPAVGDGSGADLTTLTNHLNAELGNPMDNRGDDTYWTGKGLGRAARIAEIADQLNLTSVRDRRAERHPQPAHRLVHRLARQDQPGLLLRPATGAP